MCCACGGSASAPFLDALDDPGATESPDDDVVPGDDDNAEPSRGIALCDDGVTLCADGTRWIGRGISLVGLAVAPQHVEAAGGVWASSQALLTSDASRAASFATYARWNIDVLRFQIAATSLDIASARYDASYAPFILRTLKAARDAGFRVIVSMRPDEPDDAPICDTKLPCDGFVESWQTLFDAEGTSGYALRDDTGAILELYNEPLAEVSNTEDNWRAWMSAFQPLLEAVRARGARNLLIVDGIRAGKFAPIASAYVLADPLERWALGVHPYPLKLKDIDYYRAVDWDAAYGNYCTSHACYATEWSTSSRNACYGYPAPAAYPGLSSPELALATLRYLDAHGLGMAVWPGDYVAAIMADRDGNPTTFGDLATFACDGELRGMGAMTQRLYVTGEIDTIE